MILQNFTMAMYTSYVCFLWGHHQHLELSSFVARKVSQNLLTILACKYFYCFLVLQVLLNFAAKVSVNGQTFSFA